MRHVVVRHDVGRHDVVPTRPRTSMSTFSTLHNRPANSPLRRSRRPGPAAIGCSPGSMTASASCERHTSGCCGRRSRADNASRRPVADGDLQPAATVNASDAADLRKGRHRELPHVDDTAGESLPRVYLMARELIAHSDGVTRPGESPPVLHRLPVHSPVETGGIVVGLRHVAAGPH